MSVVAWEPNNLDAPVIVAFSDARDSFEAIREIDAWAHDHDLVRAKENWLAAVGREGRTLYRGACYPAPTADQIAYQQALLRDAERRRESMPRTTSSERLHEAED